MLRRFAPAPWRDVVRDHYAGGEAPGPAVAESTAAETPAPAARAGAEGFVDSVQPSAVAGWARRRDSDRAIGVRLLLDDELLASGQADDPREDLARIYGGRGAHGFRIALPHPLPAEQLARLRVLAEGDSEPLPLTDAAKRGLEGQDAG